MTDFPPLAFLCSVYPLRHLRRGVNNWSQRSGVGVWIAEYVPKEKGRPALKVPKPDEVSPAEYMAAAVRVTRACAEGVRESKIVICVLGGYGSTTFPFPDTLTTISELELFQAALHLKPLYVLRLPDTVDDPRLTGLLELLGRIHPWIRPPRPCMDQEDAIDKVVEIVTAETTRVPRTRSDLPGELADSLRRLLAVWGDHEASDALGTELRFLDGHFVGVAPDPVKRDLVERLIQGADSCEDEATRLAFLWVAIRHLAAAPYDKPENAEFLPLWYEALRRWASAAAWYGAHGYLKHGRLAASNSLREIQAKLALTGPTRSIHASLGALASEYYSMAKLASSPAQRRQLLHDALACAREALLAGNTEDKSGLLLIKGPTELQLGRRGAAIRSCKRALRIRKLAREDPGRIGEAETHLGFARLSRWYFPWNLLSARRLLKAGVQKLKDHRRDGFFVTAQKKLGYCYLFFYLLLFLKMRAAIKEFEDARELAYERCYFDQVIQLDDVLSALKGINGRIALARWLIKHVRQMTR